MSDEVTAQLHRLESSLAAQQQSSEKQIRVLTEKLEALQAENRRLREYSSSKGGPLSDVLSRRVEWKISGLNEKKSTLPKGESIWSPEFSAAGINGMQLEFFPNGRESATIDGFCSVFFWCPEGTRLRYQLFVGSHLRAPDEDYFEARMGHGHSNFCSLEAEAVEDEVTIGVTILDVIREEPYGEGLIVKNITLAQAISQHLAKVEHRAVNRVEWKLSKISKKLEFLPRGASVFSPVFTAAGVKDILLEFYPNGNSNTQKDGFCSLYIRCPEGAQIVVTLFVGSYRKGPIMAKFEGPAGKGLPEFCFLKEQIDNEDDSVTVGVEIKNALQNDPQETRILKFDH